MIEHNDCGTENCCGDCGSVTRKWGYYTVLAKTDKYVVKELNFKPGGYMAPQRHAGRHEHWFLIEGEIVFNGKIIDAPASWDVKVGHWHEARNISTERAVVIETWTGEKFDESDIERKEDSN